MRDNEDRFAEMAAGDLPLTTNQMPAVQQDGSSLGFVSPTEIVDLPSEGKFYPVGHPLHGKSSIEIKYMTAKEEDILTNKSLIKKGVVLDRMLQSLIVDKNINLEDLLIGDKNALIVASRISGYGPEYTLKVTCPSCENKAQHTFDLSKLESKPSEDLSILNVRSTEDCLFEADLSRSRVTVKFKLLTGKEEGAIAKQLIEKNKELEEKASTSFLKTMIVSVQGNTDKAVISQFVDNMPVLDAKLLRGIHKRLTPNINMEQEFTCPSCGHSEQMEVPFTAEFFWPE